MKHPLYSTLGLAVLVSISLFSTASAAVSIDFVSVGNANNAPDTTGYGAVAYNYRIAKNETTINQYAEFLNATAKADPYGLYNTRMSSTGGQSNIAGIDRSGISGSYTYSVVSGSGNKPITYVNWFDAARFCNWMQNGQGGGSTETGAYTLNGGTSGIVTANVGATVLIPSENQWYKAAYYDPTKGGVGGYWQTPAQSDALAGNTMGVANSANYYDGDYVGYPVMVLTDVGAYGTNSDSFYGTNDQGGNVLEWNDSVVGSSRRTRGGCWADGEIALSSSYSTTIDPSYEDFGLGFRVASVPEPTSVFLAIFGSGMLVIRRKR